jgi:hypothetical protein
MNSKRERERERESEKERERERERERKRERKFTCIGLEIMIVMTILSILQN